MRRISMTDASFLYAEKRQTPMHVGGLHLFTFPEGVDETEYLLQLKNVLWHEEEYRPPFGEYVKTGRAGPLGPLYWERDANFDINYHVRHSALPQPGRYRELFVLISRLHSILLDRNRPLWEIHLIEGLQNRQFAMYQKIHHAAIDGASGMHMISAMYSKDPTVWNEHAPFSQASYETYKNKLLAARAEKIAPQEKELRNISEVLKAQFDTSMNLFKALKQFGGVFLGGGDGLRVPWYNVPRTSINTDISGSRRFVAQSWDFDRIKTICRAVNGTVNDVVLTLCGSALRRYLESQGDLPKESLKAMTPVSLREADDLDSSNAVGFMIADLGTNQADPEARLRQVQESMNAGKKLLSNLSKREAMLFVQLTEVPAMLSSLLGLSSRFPPFSTVVSNVPGPREQLYWNGAPLSGMYPASIVYDGLAMNITLLSYNNQLHFGILACRRSIPNVQRVIDYMEDALVELEEMIGLPGARKAGNKRKTTAKTKPSATSTSATRSKAKTRVKAKTKAKTKTASGKARAKTKSAAPKKKAAAKKASRPKARS